MNKQRYQGMCMGSDIRVSQMTAVKLMASSNKLIRGANRVILGTCL